jgi:hypothetical protein
MDAPYFSRGGKAGASGGYREIRGGLEGRVVVEVELMQEKIERGM